MFEAIVVIIWSCAGVLAGGMINAHLQRIGPGFSSWFFAFGWSICAGPIALVAALVTVPLEWSMRWR